MCCESGCAGSREGGLSTALADGFAGTGDVVAWFAVRFG